MSYRQRKAREKKIRAARLRLERQRRKDVPELPRLEEETVEAARNEKTHLLYLLKNLPRLRKESPCSLRNKGQCMNDCVWVDSRFWWGGKCRDRDVLGDYVSLVCEPELLDQVTTSKEIKKMGKDMGYRVKDFGKTEWKQVTKREICQKISQDAQAVSQMSISGESPWEELGISQKTYKRLVVKGMEEFAKGESFFSIFSSLRAYITKENIKTAATITVVVLTVILAVMALYPATASMKAKKVVPGRELETYREGRLTVAQTEPSLYLPEAKEHPTRYLDTSIRENSVLDLMESSGITLSGVTVAPLDITAKELAFETQNTRSVLNSKEMCGMGAIKEVEYIRNIIDLIGNSTGSMTDFLDYKEWGLLPGQQIYYGGAFGLSSLTHHGIYIGGGLVAEVGSGPLSCSTVKRNMIGFKDQMFGLNTLTNFAKVAQSQESSLHIVTTEDDHYKDVIIRRLQRAQELIGCWDYNILENNCELAANYVSFGEMSSTQARTVIQSSRLLIIGFMSLAGMIAYWRRISR